MAKSPNLSLLLHRKCYSMISSKNRLQRYSMIIGHSNKNKRKSKRYDKSFKISHSSKLHLPYTSSPMKTVSLQKSLKKKSMQNLKKLKKYLRTRIDLLKSFTLSNDGYICAPNARTP